MSQVWPGKLHGVQLFNFSVDQLGMLAQSLLEHDISQSVAFGLSPDAGVEHAENVLSLAFDRNAWQGQQGVTVCNGNSEAFTAMKLQEMQLLSYATCLGTEVLLLQGEETNVSRWQLTNACKQYVSTRSPLANQSLFLALPPGTTPARSYTAWQCLRFLEDKAWTHCIAPKPTKDRAELRTQAPSTSPGIACPDGCTYDKFLYSISSSACLPYMHC